jgi:hypothetical protein
MLFYLVFLSCIHGLAKRGSMFIFLIKLESYKEILRHQQKMAYRQVVFSLFFYWDKLGQTGTKSIT